MNSPATMPLFASSDAAPPPALTPPLTPMLAQYWQLKNQHPDCLLLFRLGDFYELFFDDAVRAAPVLEVVLTRRGKASDGNDIPMCGVPWHQLENHAAKLLRRGWSVAICEQVEGSANSNPAPIKQGKTGKTLMNRQVVRIMTPGTLTEEPLLNPRESSWLACLAESDAEGAGYALAWAELSTGLFHTQALRLEEVESLLFELQPRELLLPENLGKQVVDPALLGWNIACKRLPPSRWNSKNAERLLCQHYQVGTLSGFAELSGGEVTAAGVLLDYLQLTQLGQLPHLRPPQPRQAESLLAIDAATRRGLELTATMGGERTGSLLEVLDATMTTTGSRLLAKRLAAPLADLSQIEARLDELDALITGHGLRDQLRQILKQCPDLLRPLSRLCMNRGGPRDLAALSASLDCAGRLRLLLRSCIHEQGLVALQLIADKLGDHHALADELARALQDDLPVLARDGYFIRPGYSDILDEQRQLSMDSTNLLAALEIRFRQQTGVANLRLKAHQQFGHVVEVAPTQAERLLAAGFTHRQSLSNLVRFHHPELQELSQRLLACELVALSTEQRLFEQLVARVNNSLATLTLTAEGLAELDVTAALAEVAAQQNWCRPQFVPQPVLEITAGQHPVVASAMHASGAGQFTANDCHLHAGQRLWLMTGPNMAGKSTFLRQNALIVILAQMGCFVPAQRCRLGLVDRLFARIGASDDLAKGRSTFMVEMVETARMLHQASEKSLLIMDEIGRGTATHDGLALAQAVVEHLHHHNRCRGLFATHYHELTVLADSLQDLACYSMAVRDWQGSVVFLHEVVAGAAQKSYGLHVAQLAGLPAPTLARAAQLLAELERGIQARGLPSAVIAATSIAPIAPMPNPTLQLLTTMDPDLLTPKQALELCYQLQQSLKG